MVVAFAVTDVARDVDVRKKVHFYLYDAVALAGFAPPAGNIEAEASRRIASCLGVPGSLKQLPYRSEHLDICGGVGARSSPYRALVDADDVIEIVGSGDFIAIPLCSEGAVDLGSKVRVKHSVDK